MLVNKPDRTTADVMGRLLNIVTPLHKAPSAITSPAWWTTRSTACSRPRNTKPITGTATAATATAATSTAGRWKPVAQALIDTYGLKAGSRVLDVGCGKAFLLYEMQLIEPGLELVGFDISNHGLASRPPDLKATPLPLPRPGRLSVRRQAIRPGHLARLPAQPAASSN